MMAHSVLVILDGLRRDMVTEANMPRLAAFAAANLRCEDHRSVFPSVTRVASATIATGCWPKRHELMGNTLGLIEGQKLVMHDAGHPNFLQHKRQVTGRSLAVPTLAERVKDIGGAVIFNNVSPGAAYAHDPDGYGHVYHRTMSYGPGRLPVEKSDQLNIGSDLAGDRAMTHRFVDDVLKVRKPAFAVLWLGHPDTTQHEVPLGSPEHLAALKMADENVGLVIDAVEERRAAGEDILLLVGSDHGHQTISGSIDIGAELVRANLKQSETSDDVVIAPNGTAALVYVNGDDDRKAWAIRDFLLSQHWVDRVIPYSAFSDFGLAAREGLTLAVSMKSRPGKNPFGIPGMSIVAAPSPEKVKEIGCGQHGGLGTYEQAPALFLSGFGFSAGAIADPTSLVDIAPTVLAHLGLPIDGMDGRSLLNPVHHSSKPPGEQSDGVF